MKRPLPSWKRPFSFWRSQMSRALIVVLGFLGANAVAATLPGAPPAPAQARKRGSLDKEVIRRVIRTHLDDVKACYEARLAEKPELAGRVMMQFTISGTGDVTGARAIESDLDDPRTGE